MTSNNGDNEMQNVIINGVEYAPIKQATGTRAVIVVDRGWIFAGNVTRANGRIKLANALHVFKWESMVEKYGLDKAREMQKRPNASLGGKANKGKPKSEEHKRKISEKIKQKHLTKQIHNTTV